MSYPIPPSLADVLQKLTTRLVSDSTLSVMVGSRIYNHAPQEVALPMVKFRIDQQGEWDTKDSAGFDGTITVDAFTSHRGDKEAMTIVDRVIAILQLQPLTLAGDSQHLYIRHSYTDFVTEGDGLTHHGIVKFRTILTN